MNFFFLLLEVHCPVNQHCNIIGEQFLKGCRKTCMTVSDNTEQAKHSSTIRHVEHAKGSNRSNSLYTINAFHKYIAGYTEVQTQTTIHQIKLTYTE